jgi:hypothetical protein
MCEMCNLSKFIEKPRSEWAILKKISTVYRELGLPVPDRIIPMLEKAAELRKSIRDKPAGMSCDELELVGLYGSIRALFVYSVSSSRSELSLDELRHATQILDLLEQVMDSTGICEPTVERIQSDLEKERMAKWFLEHPEVAADIMRQRAEEHPIEEKTLN